MRSIADGDRSLQMVNAEREPDEVESCATCTPGPGLREDAPQEPAIPKVAGSAKSDTGSPPLRARSAPRPAGSLARGSDPVARPPPGRPTPVAPTPSRAGPRSGSGVIRVGDEAPRDRFGVPAPRPLRRVTVRTDPAWFLACEDGREGAGPRTRGRSASSPARFAHCRRACTAQESGSRRGVPQHRARANGAESAIERDVRRDAFHPLVKRTIGSCRAGARQVYS